MVHYQGRGSRGSVISCTWATPQAPTCTFFHYTQLKQSGGYFRPSLSANIPFLTHAFTDRAASTGLVSIEHLRVNLRTRKRNAWARGKNKSHKTTSRREEWKRRKKAELAWRREKSFHNVSFEAVRWYWPLCILETTTTTTTTTTTEKVPRTEQILIL